MKRVIIAMLYVLLPMFVVAQQERSFEIDASSFEPEQKGVLEGVAIDKIAPDYSNRPCARIKLYINRMSREDISQVSVKTVGGNVVIMKSEVATEGNGLIIELTARPNVRLYLHHDKYGDSNEVTLNLEANEVYKLDAQLSVLQSIVVASNVVGAEVYIDEVFRGRTNDEFRLTVNDVTYGIHSLRVVYGAVEHKQQIDVSSADIYFNAAIEQASNTSQYVVFEVSPKSATVVINDKDIELDSYGIGSILLRNGTYRYTVSASEYYTESGEITVRGDKVEKRVQLRPAHGWLSVPSTSTLVGATVYVDGENIGTAPLKSGNLASGTHNVRIVKRLYKSHESVVTITDGKTLDYSPELIADYATVTLTSAPKSQIYVNNEYKGVSPWTGDLASGVYIFEARMSGHKTASIERSISSERSRQSYVIPDPEPIWGKIEVKSSPAMAEVYVDGGLLGKTPLLENVIIGMHKISIRKEGYNNYEESVNISEGEIRSINASLKKRSAATYTSPSYSSMSNSSTSSYNSYKGTQKSTSTKQKRSRSWDSFNIGPSLGVGYLMGDESAVDPEFTTSEGKAIEYNVGFMWRMWRHNSLLNIMTGATYMRANGCNYLGFPVVVNWNINRGSDMCYYIGAGTEVNLSFEWYKYYKTTELDFPLILQVGIGTRHGDYNMYFKYYSHYGLGTVGLRYTYLF